MKSSNVTSCYVRGNVQNVPETDKMFRLIAEKPFAPAGSGRRIVQVGTEGFIRTGQ